MRVADHRDVLIAPVISEKSYGLLDENKYTFIVDPDANKTEIKIAVEKVFGVKVVSVNTQNREGKRVRTRRGFGRRVEHQARHRLRGRRRPHRHLRRSGLLTAGPGRERGTSWESASTSRQRRAAVARRSPTSWRSPGPRRRSHWSSRCPGRAGGTTRGGSRRATRAAGTSAPTASIDFRRADKDGVPATVAHIEYDPNRTARIALLHFADGEKRYIVAPNKLKQGDRVETGPSADIKPGNNLPLRNIPVGTVIHAVELRPGGGAKIARSAGSSVQLVAKDGPYAQLRMPSGEIRNVDVALPGHRRRGRQRRAVEHQLGQGRPHALEGQAPDRARRGHEPGRPPARRWRGQDVRWPPPGQPERQARGPHPRRRTRPPTSSSSAGARPARSAEDRHATQPEEGPLRRRPPGQEGGRPERQGDQERDQDLVAPLDDRPGRCSGTPSPCTTGASTSRCSSPRTWSATSWASSPRPGRSAATSRTTARPSAASRRQPARRVSRQQHDSTRTEQGESDGSQGPGTVRPCHAHEGPPCGGPHSWAAGCAGAGRAAVRAAGRERAGRQGARQRHRQRRAQPPAHRRVDAVRRRRRTSTRVRP